MLIKFAAAFGILALVAGVAGSITPKSPTYKITISQPAVIMGTALKAGDYRLTVNPGTVTFTFEKESHQIPVKVETNAKKFDTDQVRYVQDGNGVKISEICVGGTKTRLVFN